MINEFHHIKSADVAAALGITSQAVNRWVKEGRLPPHEVPGITDKSGRFWYLSTLRAAQPDLARVVVNHLAQSRNPLVA